MVSNRRRQSIVDRTLSFLSAARKNRRQRRARARRLQLEGLEPRQLLAGDQLAAVTTDKPDYAPGETVRIAGSGFALGQAVELQVLHLDGGANDGSGHAPWYVADGGTGDLDGQADGRFATLWYVNPDDSLGAAFGLTARGVAAGPDGLLGTPDDVYTGEMSSTTFTDGNLVIGNYVWQDANGNGLQDGGESGIGGVTLTLTGQTTGGLAVTHHATTSVIGIYSFSEDPGTYTVMVDATNFDSGGALYGYSPTAPLQGTNRAKDSNGSPSGTSPATLSTTWDQDVDFGYYKPASIGDYVWVDANGNGVQDAGESGLGGVTVKLLDSSGTNTLQTTTTDANGHYSFTAMSGTYKVAATAPTGYVATATGKGTAATDSNASPSSTSPTLLPAGGSDANVDFGFYQLVSIGDYVWQDTNANGLQDADELGINSVTLTLTGTDGTGTTITPVQTTTSNNSGVAGHYQFSNLKPGTYTVTVDANNFAAGHALQGYTITATLPGADPAKDSNGNPSRTSPPLLPSGSNDEDADFGFHTTADLSITVTDNSNTAVPGTNTTYTIVASNLGTSAVTSATVSDALPSGASWLAVASAGATVTPTTGTASINCTVDLEPGATVAFTAVVPISPAATGSLSNTATLTATGDTNLGNNTATDTDTLTPQANLQITTADGMFTYAPGASTTYTIVVNNSGPSDASNVSIQDTFPTAITSDNWTATATGGATDYTSAGQGNIHDTVTLPRGSTITYTITANISLSATGNLVNTATVSPPSGVADSDPTNNTATDTDTPALQSDLSITQTDATATYTPGTGLTYTIVVHNGGPSNVVGAIVTDTFDPALGTPTWSATGTSGTQFGSGGVGSLSRTVNIPAGGSITYTVTVTKVDPARTGELVNTATVSPPGGVTDPLGNNTAVDTNTPSLVADLSITQTDNATSYTPGLGLTYRIVVSNAGPSNVSGALVADSFDLALGTPTWSATGTGGTVFANSGSGNLAQPVSIPAGGSLTYTATIAKVDPTRTGQLLNTATVTAPSGVSDSLGNNTATDTDTPSLVADLSVTQTDNTTSYTPGLGLTYKIVASNAGPSDVVGATLADSFDPALGTPTWSATGTSGTVLANSGSGNLAQTVSIPAGGSITYTVTVAKVDPARTGNLLNTVTVTAPSGVSDSQGNNAATDTDTASLVADLSITQTDDASSYTPGSLVTYTIVVTNHGPSNAVGATVADAIPLALNGVSWTSSAAGSANVTSGGSGTGNNLGATLTVPAGAGSSVVFTITATAQAAATANLVNRATVSPPSGTSDNYLPNNTATDTDIPALRSDLSITQTDETATYTPGTGLTYTILVHNGGPSNVVGAIVTDTFDPALGTPTWSATGTSGTQFGSGGVGSLSRTVNIPAGGSITYTATVTKVDPARTGELVNTATVNPPGGVTDPLGNNTAVDTNTPSLVADLSITQTDNATSYTPGLGLTYKIVVSNAGPSNVSGALVADCFDLAQGTPTWSATGTGGTVFANSGSGNLAQTVSIPAGGSLTYTATIAKVDPARTGELVNTATVTAPSGVSDSPGNNTATDTDAPSPVADLSITQTDNATSYTPGSLVTYTITVTNNGPSNAVGATVADTLPAGLTSVSWTSSAAGAASVTSGGSGSGNNLGATVSVPAGAGNAVMFTVTGTAQALATGNLINTAMVSPLSGTVDNHLANNTATDSDTPTPQVDLSITTTDNSPTYTPGNPVTYTITVTNRGRSDVVGAAVADAIPATLSEVSWTSSSLGTATVTSGWAGAGNHLAALLNVPAGAGNSVVFTVTGTAQASAAGDLVNTATVAPPVGTSDLNLGDNTSADTDTPALQADLSLVETDYSDTYTPGRGLTYTIVVTNDGPSNVVGALVADVFDGALGTPSWTASGTAGTVFVAGGAGNLSQTVSIPVNGSITYSVKVDQVNPAQTGDLINTATVTPPANVTDSTQEDNTATDTDTSAPQADLQITKTGGTLHYVPGSSTTYALVVRNNGPSHVAAARVSQAFPAAIASDHWTATATGGATGFTADGSGTLSDTVTLPVGSEITYAVTVQIRASATGKLVNSAMVTAPAGVADLAPSNNVITDTDAQYLAISMDDGTFEYQPGNSATYIIVVTNTGSDAVTGATVTDTFPADITSTRWTATATGGATGFTPSGSGNLADTAMTLPPGSAITYTVAAHISSTATGNLVNTATVTGPNVSEAISDTDTPYSPRVFYLPFPAHDVLTALQGIQPLPTTPVSPIAFYASLAISQEGTRVYYDQWENGFVAELYQPTPAETYNSSTNPGGVQIWGDGDITNGVPPGYERDLLRAGDIITLPSPSIEEPRLLDSHGRPLNVYFDGGDKIAANHPISIGELSWASNTGTLLTGAMEVYDTSTWGSQYDVPIGEDTTTNASTKAWDSNGQPLANLPNFFDYSGLAIMAACDGTQVLVDKHGDGTGVITQTLNQGQSFFVDEVRQGATVVSTDPAKPVQVNLITGRKNANYQSRRFTLTPRQRASSSYFTPVSTHDYPTGVYLFNPNTDGITVTYEYRVFDATRALERHAIHIIVPPKSAVLQVVPELSGAHFYTAGGQSFYALSVTDVASDAAVSNPDSQAELIPSSQYEWGMSLIPESRLTSQALIALGFGRDPTVPLPPDEQASGKPENGSPVWVTPVGNGDRPVTVYVDYQGDGAGPSTDPSGFQYDAKYDLLELQSQQVFDPRGDQSGMLVYTLDPAVRLAVAWGESPWAAPLNRFTSVGEPGIDAGTYVPPLPEFDAQKKAELIVDANGDGVVSSGDTLRYTIVVTNTSRLERIDDIRLLDNLPAETTYVPNSTSYTITLRNGNPSGPVVVTDETSGTPFPLDAGGAIVPRLDGGTTYVVTFLAQVADTLAPHTTSLVDSGTAQSPSLLKTVQFRVETPLYRLGDYVWADTNSNGIQDADETGIGGVTVRLLDDQATTLRTTTTDANGHYSFTVAPGTYQLQFVALSGAVFTRQHATVDPEKDSDADPSGFTAAITLSANPSGASDQTIDAGLYIPATIGDYVWADLNSDGIQQAEEPGVSGVTVKLLDGTGSTTQRTTIADGSGRYRFTNLTPGTYQLQFVPPNGYLFTAALQGTRGELDSNANPTTGKSGPITLVSGQSDLTWDAGFLPIDLSLTQTVDQPAPLVGTRVVFALTVKNATGLSTPTGVSVKDLLPAGLTYVSSTVSQGSYHSATGIWTVGTLASPGKATLVLTATVTTAGTKTNFAEIWTAREQDLDSTPGNGPQTPPEDDEAGVFVTPPPIVVIGRDDCTVSQTVQVIAADTGFVRSEFVPYEDAFLGGVRVATGDVDRDRIDEIVTAPGRGRPPDIRVFEQDGTPVESFTAYASTFSYGVEVTVADANGDGFDDVITVPSYGAAEVRVFWNTQDPRHPFDAANFKKFVAYPTASMDGWVVAAADMGQWNGSFVNVLDEKAEIVIGTGSGIKAALRVFALDANGEFSLVQTLSPFTAISSGFLGGVSLDVARINDDAIPDLVVGAGTDGASQVEVYAWNNSSSNAALLPTPWLAFRAFSGAGNFAPIRVAAQANLAGIADTIYVVQGPGGTAKQILSFDLTRWPPASRPVSGTYPAGLFIATVKNAASTASPLDPTLFDPSDVNHDGQVTPLDVLVLINFLNVDAGVRRAALSPSYDANGVQSVTPQYDVNGDGSVTPQDVLLVINGLDSLTTAAGEGEGEAALAGSAPPESGAPDSFGSLVAVRSPSAASPLQFVAPALPSPTAASSEPRVAGSPAHRDFGLIATGGSGNGRRSLLSDVHRLAVPERFEPFLDGLELTLAEIAEDVRRGWDRGGKTA